MNQVLSLSFFSFPNNHIIARNYIPKVRWTQGPRFPFAYPLLNVHAWFKLTKCLNLFIIHQNYIHDAEINFGLEKYNLIPSLGHFRVERFRYSCITQRKKKQDEPTHGVSYLKNRYVNTRSFRTLVHFFRPVLNQIALWELEIKQVPAKCLKNGFLWLFTLDSLMTSNDASLN